MLDRVGTHLQLLSPRPFQMMHSAKPSRIVHWFTEETNNIIARTVKLLPERFVGVAGLPQAAGEPIENVLPELERCVRTLGFKGCLLNPDPYENGREEAPSLGDRYWYPLYEKLCELGVPAHIHATGSQSERTPYTLALHQRGIHRRLRLGEFDVLKDFPDLKIVISHGGGAIPYQIGRFQSGAARKGFDFLERMRKLYLRHRAVLGGGVAASDQDGGGGSLSVRRRVPGRRLDGRSRDGPNPRRHQADDREP